MQGLGDKIQTTLVKTFNEVLDKIGLPTNVNIKKNMPFAAGKGLLKEELFQSPQGKEMAKAINTEMAKGVMDGFDMTEAALDLLLIRATKMQFEIVSGVNVSNQYPTLNALFTNQAITGDMNLIITCIGVILEALSLGQIDQVQNTIAASFENMGLNQLGKEGYSMIINTAFQPRIQKEILFQTRSAVFDPNTALKMFFRGLITEEQLADELSHQGWSDAKMSQLIDSSWYYPNPTDFIRFGLREVFRNDIVSKYGYDDDNPINEKIPLDQLPTWLKAGLPGKDATLANLIEVAGLDPNVFRWYWRAHWELPSPSQGFEMLQRQLITTEELTTLLRISDFAPYWIEKLIGISYAPYTRVDARNMFMSGVLTEEEYIRANMDIGYPRDKAEKILQWVKTSKMTNEKDLTQTSILDAYEKGIKNRAWAITGLKGLGFDDAEADLIISLREYKAVHTELDDKTSLLTKQFTLGLIDEATFTAEVNKLGLTEEAKKKLLAKAQITKSEKITLPSKDDLIRWLTAGIINTAGFTDKMRLLGYLSKDIDNYITENELRKG